MLRSKFLCLSRSTQAYTQQQESTSLEDAATDLYWKDTFFTAYWDKQKSFRPDVSEQIAASDHPSKADSRDRSN